MEIRKALILAVDDNPQNLQFLGKLLSDSGYEVGMGQNGRQALNFVKKNEPDLILLKTNLGTRHIPVIFLTAKTDSNDIVKGFDAGGVDYVTKPFNSAELLARIKTHVEIKMLRGLLPICSKCKKIRDDEGFWKQVDSYIEEHSEIIFTHGICPDCLTELYGEKDWFKKRK